MKWKLLIKKEKLFHVVNCDWAQDLLFCSSCQTTIDFEEAQNKVLRICPGGTSIDANILRSWQTRLKCMGTAIVAIIEKL